MLVIDRNAIRVHELTRLAASVSEHEGERAIVVARVDLHSQVPAVGHEQEASMMVERQASRQVEPADRELDSSIINDITRIATVVVAHRTQGSKQGERGRKRDARKRRTRTKKRAS